MTERVTYFAAVPLARRDDREIVEDFNAAVECESPDAAIMAAAKMARSFPYIGSVAFERTYDPASRRYEPAVLLRKFGDITVQGSLIA
jgi:hypothetical protein